MRRDAAPEDDFDVSGPLPEESAGGDIPRDSAALLPPELLSTRRRFPWPRLLPLTILALAALLSVKVVGLASAWWPGGPLRTASAVVFAVANAASPEPAKAEPAKAEPAKPATASTEPPKPAAAAPAPRPGEAAAPGSPVVTSGSSVMPIGEAAASAGPMVSDSERALLSDLRTRRQELDRREAALSERANLLTAAETRLAARLDELKSLQARLETMEKARQAQAEANWRGLVKVYEDMRPRDAAVIWNDLDFEVLIPVLDRMKEAKAAVLLAAMEPARAREATARLAKRRADATTVAGPPGADTPPVPAATGAPPAAPPVPAAAGALPVTRGADASPAARGADASPVARETDTPPVAQAAAALPVTRVTDAPPVARGADALPVARPAGTLPVARGADALPVARGADAPPVARGVGGAPPVMRGTDAPPARGADATSPARRANAPAATRTGG